jgi:hypothetical protein
MYESAKNSADTKHEYYAQLHSSSFATTSSPPARPVHPNSPSILKTPNEGSIPTATRASTNPSQDSEICTDGQPHCWQRKFTFGDICWLICCFLYGAICCYFGARKRCIKCQRYENRDV